MTFTDLFGMYATLDNLIIKYPLLLVVGLVILLFISILALVGIIIEVCKNESKSRSKH